MTDDLVAFLRARLDEDQRTARATLWDGSGNTLNWDLPASATVSVGEDEFYAGDRTIANHIARHDPARVLREIEAKRWIVNAAEKLPALTKNYDLFDNNRDAWANTLRKLAAVYADHPDYKEKWRP